MGILRAVASGLSVLSIVVGSLENTAYGAVFRCAVEGRTLYTDKPCRAGDSPHALPWLGVVPAGEQADLATDHDTRRERVRDARQRDDAEWLEAHASRQATDRRMESAIREKRTAPGMSADQVRRALGRPDAVKRERNGEERWTYRDGRKRQTVRLRQGKVVGKERGTKDPQPSE